VHVLPEDWADQAWELGVMQRARYIKDPAVRAARFAAQHVGAGCSLAGDRRALPAAGLAPISSVGCLEDCVPRSRVSLLGPADARGNPRCHATAGAPLRAVDATSVHEPGTTGTDWKLHYLREFGRSALRFFSTYRYSGKEAKRFGRVPVVAWRRSDGDRVYAAPPGVSACREPGRRR